MQDLIYVQLREKLDRLGTGYPATANEVEYTFLKRAFSLTDAEYFIAMPDGFHTPAEFARALGRDPGAVAEQLESMAKRGLIFRRHRDGQVQYRTSAFVYGLLEYGLLDIDLASIPDFFEHFVGGVSARLWETDTPVVRTIPLNKEIAGGSTVLPFDDAEAIVRRQDYIAVAKCICRDVGAKTGNPCKHPMDTCLQFGDAGRFYVDNGWGRVITQDEAMAILKEGDEHGRAIQTVNSQDPPAFCSCCTCHCASLGGHTRVAHPTTGTNYYCVKDTSLCSDSCPEICTGRCPVHALTLVEGSSRVDASICIGCGLCVSTCPTQALSLAMKPGEAIYTPPATVYDAWEAQARYRQQKARTE